jgi:triosephosphate isomerase
MAAANHPTAPRQLIAGNWKMNGTRAALDELKVICAGFRGDLAARLDGLICPPATLVNLAAHVALGSRLAIGGQDCHARASGAHTGDVSAEMLADAGATHVILGHSERRQDHRETDAMVADKTRAAWAAGLTAIVCVGETRAERESGKTLNIVRRQVRGSVPDGATPANLVIAYEPVWAIGTGLTPTVADVAEVHALIRTELARLVGKTAAARVRILYGGSVKPGNAAELLAIAHVDGALIGGASLTASDFLAIARACPAR